MEDTIFTFVKKFRIDNLDFKVFKNKSGNYFVIDRNQEDGTEQANFYLDEEKLHDVFSDDFTAGHLG